MSTKSTTNTLIQTVLFARMTEKVLDDMADYILVIGALQHQMLKPDAEFLSLYDLRLTQQQAEENERLLNTLWGYLDLAKSLTKRERDQHGVAGIESFRTMLQEGQNEVVAKVERSTEALEVAQQAREAAQQVATRPLDAYATGPWGEPELDPLYNDKVAGRVTNVDVALIQALDEDRARKSPASMMMAPPARPAPQKMMWLHEEALAEHASRGWDEVQA